MYEWKLIDGFLYKLLFDFVGHWFFFCTCFTNAPSEHHLTTAEVLGNMPTGRIRGQEK